MITEENMENRRMSKNVFPLTIMKDDIVISGISGRFPESDSVDEFRDNLYNNVDMITSDDRRWPIREFYFSFTKISSKNFC
jgi:acyl transferase domain-containing protein